MSHCSGALNDSETVGTSLCGQTGRKWLECPSAKPLCKKKPLVQPWMPSLPLITLCYVLTRSRDTCFPKSRHWSMNLEHLLSVFTDSQNRHIVMPPKNGFLQSQKHTHIGSDAIWLQMFWFKYYSSYFASL